MSQIDNQKLLFINTIKIIISKDTVKKEIISLNNFRVIGILESDGFRIVYKVKVILKDIIYVMKVMNKNKIINKKYFHIVNHYDYLIKLMMIHYNMVHSYDTSNS